MLANVVGGCGHHTHTVRSLYITKAALRASDKARCSTVKRARGEFKETEKSKKSKPIDAMNRTDTLATANSAGDLERGGSKDLDTLAGTGLDDSEVVQAPRPFASTHPARSASHKYLLLSVFCLGVFIDGESLRMSESCVVLVSHADDQYLESASFTSSWRRLRTTWILCLSSRLGSL